jgi:hypothetical protein
MKQGHVPIMLLEKVRNADGDLIVRFGPDAFCRVKAVGGS